MYIIELPSRDIDKKFYSLKEAEDYAWEHLICGWCKEDTGGMSMCEAEIDIRDEEDEDFIWQGIPASYYLTYSQR
ncbi:MAG: hypothetical protein WC965_01485 [Thiohalomonadaceae bacterium]